VYDLCSILQGLVDFDGYYLEHDPCLVCNNPEIPFAVCHKFVSVSSLALMCLLLIFPHVSSPFVFKLLSLSITSSVFNPTVKHTFSHFCLLLSY